MEDRDLKELALLTRNIMFRIGAVKDEAGMVSGFLTRQEWSQITGQPEYLWDGVSKQMMALGHPLDMLAGRGYFLGDKGGPGRVMGWRVKSAATLLQGIQEITEAIRPLSPEIRQAIHDALEEDLASRDIGMNDVGLLIKAANKQLPAGDDLDGEFSRMLLN